MNQPNELWVDDPSVPKIILTAVMMFLLLVLAIMA